MAEESNSVGRPSVITPEVIRKLEEVFAIGGSDLEACFYADISKTALYEYQKDHPEFTERKEELKEKPILKARKTIVKGLDDPLNARWYLERKKKSEFAQRSELTGADGKDLPQPIMVNVSSNNSDKKDNGDDGEDKSGSGGNLSEQDSIDSLMADSSGTE